jgi:hypothetical protein
VVHGHDDSNSWIWMMRHRDKSVVLVASVGRG